MNRIESNFSLCLGSKANSSEETHQIWHHFTSQEPIWGVQNVISFREVLDLVEGDELTIKLQFNWVRDTRLFPLQYLTLSSQQPELYMVLILFPIQFVLQ